MEIIGCSHIDLNLSLSWSINDIIDLNIMDILSNIVVYLQLTSILLKHSVSHWLNPPQYYKIKVTNCSVFTINLNLNCF